MNTQQQAYIEGFVKRAAEYGFNENEELSLALDYKGAKVVPSDLDQYDWRAVL